MDLVKIPFLSVCSAFAYSLCFFLTYTTGQEILQQRIDEITNFLLFVETGGLLNNGHFLHMAGPILVLDISESNCNRENIFFSSLDQQLSSHCFLSRLWEMKNELPSTFTGFLYNLRTTKWFCLRLPLLVCGHELRANISSEDKSGKPLPTIRCFFFCSLENGQDIKLFLNLICNGLKNQSQAFSLRSNNLFMLISKMEWELGRLTES